MSGKPGSAPSFMKAKAALAVMAATVSLMLCACLQGDRVAGSSTEAGNAGGKLSMVDGRPAAGVTVALVSRNFLPDTLAGGGINGNADVAGSYYRTRTGADGRYVFSDVAPGSYRVMALSSGVGALKDSVMVKSGNDTTLLEQVLKPLGGIRGIAKIVGSKQKVNVWVRPKATLKTPPRADLDGGTFRLDSLPEGEYELVPQCFTCQPFKDGYRVRVSAGQVTLLADTLKVYPEYFYDFPEAGDMEVRASWLPLSIGGKVNRGADVDGKPASIAWDWNGTPLAAHSLTRPDGVSETAVQLDSALFGGGTEGDLRLVLKFPDTNIVRSWHIRLDTLDRVWPLSVVRADSAIKVSGPIPHLWRFHVADSRALNFSDVSFWGIRPGAVVNQAVLPDWLYLAVEDEAERQLETEGASRLTFILAPDAKIGGRVIRPRWNENLEDFGKIHYLERAQLGFSDTLDPSMLPGWLQLERRRGPKVQQRYRVDSLGAVEELLGAITYPDPQIPAFSDPPLLFYRYGAAADGFTWEKPLRDAAKALAVTREGLAVRLDGSGIRKDLPAAEFETLKALLAPLDRDPPGLSDTCALPDTGDLEYLRAGKRGLLSVPGSGAPADSLFKALGEWMVRNGLVESYSFPLEGDGWRYLGFESDTSGLRYTGDTLVVELSASGSGVRVREFLSAGSPGRTSDSGTVEFRLKLARDSLVAYPWEAPVVSRLFGSIDGETGVFALTGLKPVAPETAYGFPILSGNGNTLSGRLEKTVDIHGRSVDGAGVWLDGRGIDRNRPGMGFLYTPEGGLERTWRFNGRNADVKGWDRQ